MIWIVRACLPGCDLYDLHDDLHMCDRLESLSSIVQEFTISANYDPDDLQSIMIGPRCAPS